jgi:hypothetical protein
MQVANPRTHDQCAYMLTSKQGVPDRRTSLLLLLFTCAALRTKSNGLPIDVPFCFYYCLHVHHHVQKARGFRSTYLFASTSFLHAYKKYGAPDRRTTLILLLFTCASPHIKSKVLPIDVVIYLLYFLHAQHRIQKARAPDGYPGLFLILFTLAVSCTKSKGLPINVSFYLLYFLHV